MYHLRKVVSNLVGRGLRKNFRQIMVNETRCRSTVTENPPGEKVLKHSVFSIPKGILGQPTCYTHPHMVQEGYLTCGITQAEFMERRDTLMTKLIRESERDNVHHVVIIPGAIKQYMSDKIPYPFRQNSDFFYLTGCLEPGAILVMIKTVDNDSYRAILFVNEKNAHSEMWEGPRTGCADSAKMFAVNEARPLETFPSFLSKSVHTKPAIIWYHRENSANTDITPGINRMVNSQTEVILADPQRALHSMRVIKSPAEIDLMKETCYIGAQSMNMAMACTKPNISEHTVAAVLDFTTRQSGAEHLAFPPVVAGGPRATHIHYVTNNQLLKPDELLLVDTGTQRWLYNSDLSRTWPVSGKFTTYQRILYELVLSVQKRLIKMLGEQRQPLDHLFDQMCRMLGTQLQQEGILPKNLTNNEIISRAYQLCPHHVSHYLGLDVHDAALVRRNIPIQSNMVVTVEPGLYIRPDDQFIPEEFRGIGIRVEDDVLITDGAPEVLTKSCVKEVDDVEATVGKHRI